jgi:hypothetical protein
MSLDVEIFAMGRDDGHKDAKAGRRSVLKSPQVLHTVTPDWAQGYRYGFNTFLAKFWLNKADATYKVLAVKKSPVAVENAESALSHALALAAAAAAAAGDPEGVSL